MPSSLANYSKDYSVSVNKPTVRSCLSYRRPVHDKCVMGSIFAAMQIAELLLPQSYHLACSCARRNIELASQSRNVGVLLPGQNPAPAKTHSALGPPSTMPLEGVLSSAPLQLQKTCPPAFGDIVTGVVEVSVYITSIVLSLIFRISGFKKIEYRSRVCLADHTVRTTLFTASDQVENLRTMFRESRCRGVFGSLSVAEGSSPTERLSVLSPVVDGKLTELLYVIDCFHRRTMRRTVIDFEVH